MFVNLLKQCLPFMLALLFASTVIADEIAVPPLAHRVTDFTATLNTEQQAALEQKLAQFEREKGSQIAVLIIPTTQPEAIEQYSIRVVEAWKLGRKKIDDGLLILVAKDDHKMRIEVGYGLEGVIPDAIAKRIVAETMAPHFHEGDFYGGLDAAVDQLQSLMAGEALPAPQHQSSNDNQWENMLPLLLFGGLFVGGVLRAVLGNFLGGAVNGGLIGMLVWLLGGGALVAVVLAMIAFVFTLLGGGNSLGGWGGGYGGGSYRGGGGDTFSGGGGGFGGGGASGNW